MPEYLAPAVYVEEVDTGSKPIEGVSTSTAGVVGMTERGPVNVPILVTSAGEFQRWFGQYLDSDVFDAGRCYLPHAIDGFFTNGGKRVYVTRVLDPTAAAPANRQLVAPDTAATVNAQLVLPAPAAATNVVVADAGGLVANATVEIGSGTGAEFRTITAAPANANVLAIGLPLAFGHQAGQSIELRTVTDNNTVGETHASNLPAASGVAAGSPSVALQNAVFNPVLAGGDLLRVGAAGADAEYVVVAGPPVGSVVPLRTPLALPHAAGAQVHRQTVVVPLGPVINHVGPDGTSAGDSVVAAGLEPGRQGS